MPPSQATFPTLILIAGGPGAGKTTLGKALAREIPHSVLLDKDTLATGWVDALLEHLNDGVVDRDSAVYFHAVRPLEYAALMALAMDNLKADKWVVAVAPFGRELADPEWRRALLDELRILGAGLFIVWVQTDPASAGFRMADRRASRDAWKLAHWEEFLERAPYAPPTAGLVVVQNDAHSSPADLLEQLRKHLEFQ